MTILWLKSLWHDDRRLRHFLLIVDVGLIAFCLYLIAYIFGHPPEKGGDGFEVFVVVVPSLIALCLSLPAFLLLIASRTLRIGAGFTLAASIANAWCWDTIAWHTGLGRVWHCSTFWTLCW